MVEERIDPETGEILPVNAQGLVPLDIPEDVAGILNKYSGAGYSDKPEDALTPILNILQDLSGEVKKNHERRLEGAESGMIIIRSLGTLFPGTPGVMVQPFGFHHMLIEWTGEPGEGMPVGRFSIDDPPNDMEQRPDPKNPTRNVLVRKSNTNRLVETREHYANIVNGVDRPFPVVIPMSGSNHIVSRRWTNLMRNMVYNGKPLPSFFRYYRLSTVYRKRGNSQSWYSWHVEPGSIILDREMLQLGANSFESIREKPLEGNLSDYGDAVDDSQEVVTPARVNVADHI